MTILHNFDHHDKKQSKIHFTNLIQIALADGNIDDKECTMLHKIGKKMGITDPEINDLIKTSKGIICNPPYEYSKRFEQVYDVVKMMLADGVIDDSEMKLVKLFALKNSFTENEIAYLIDMLIKGIKEGIDEEDLFETYKKSKR